MWSIRTIATAHDRCFRRTAGAADCGGEPGRLWTETRLRRGSGLGILGAFVTVSILVACSQEPDYSAIALPLVPSDPPSPVVQYTLSLAVTEGGQVTTEERATITGTCTAQSAPCGARYLGGETLTLEARPSSGWRFDRWENCEIARSAKIVITMPKEDLECRAMFFNFDDGFDLALMPDRLETYPGVAATAQLAIERGTSFGDLPVSFELFGAPVGVVLTAPSTAVDGSSTLLSIDVPDSATTGQYLLTLKGRARNRMGQDIERSVTLALVIRELSAFGLNLDTPVLSISRSTSCPLNVLAARSAGFTDPIALGAAPLPTGVTATFDSNPMQGDSTGWSLAATADAPYGERVIRVNGNARSITRGADLRVAVTAARDSCATGRFATPSNDDFAISAGVTSIAVPQGQSGAVDIRIDRGLGYLGEVVLQASGAPTGALLKFDPPSPVTGNGARLVIMTAEGATRGASTIVVTATGNSRIRQASFQLNITPGAMTCPLGVLADAYVNPTRSQTGSSTILEVGSNSMLSAYKSYLVFDVSRIPQPFDRVDLVVSLLENGWAAADPNSSRTISLYGIVDDSDWKPLSLTETTIHWTNAPKNDPASTFGFTGAGITTSDRVRALGSIVTLPADANTKQYRVNVTDYVRWGLGLKTDYSSVAPSDPDRLLTIMMANNLAYHVAEDNDWTTFYSRENPQPCVRPHLEVYRE